ncbi:MAG: tetratricopeptide repeat protein, partial [Gemmataceae bacterium]
MTSSADLMASAVKEYQAGKFDQAEDLCRQVLKIEEECFDALQILGLVYHALGKRQSAVEMLRAALRTQPMRGDVHFNLAKVLQEQGDLAGSEASYRQALICTPTLAEAHYNLARLLHDLGRGDEAVTCYRQAIRIRPDYPKALTNLGNFLLEQKQVPEAVAAFDQVVRLQPESGSAHSNLANALRVQERFEDALHHARRAVALSPSDATAHNNLGAAYHRLGQWQQALDSFDEAIRLQADNASARMNRAQLLLLCGDFARGWPEYEWRNTPDSSRFTVPRWDGSPLGGRRILLHAEQGLGDTLQMVRYVPLVEARGGQVILECQPRLRAFLCSSRGIGQVVAKGESVPPFDVHAPLLSLPMIFATEFATVPCKVPYLEAAPDQVKDWHQRLQSIQGFKIGIAWQGNPQYLHDGLRSVPLHHFFPLANIPGVRLVSLHKGPGLEQLQMFGNDLIVDLAERLDESAGPFVDTAAVIKNVDLVIASDSAVAHLAGALAAPVWLLLPFVPDWRWLLEREDSPWYPTLRVFRQARAGDWNEVFRRVVRELRTYLGLPSICMTIEIPPGELVDRIAILEIKREHMRDEAKQRILDKELGRL